MEYLKIKKADYDALDEKDVNTYYWIQETNQIMKGSVRVVPEIEWEEYDPKPISNYTLTCSGISDGGNIYLFYNMPSTIGPDDILLQNGINTISNEVFYLCIPYGMPGYEGYSQGIEMARYDYMFQQDNWIDAVWTADYAYKGESVQGLEIHKCRFKNNSASLDLTFID